GVAGFTVNAAGGDTTPRPVPRISVEPGDMPVASPVWSMVATDGSLDCQEKITPAISLFDASNARAVNCPWFATSIVAEAGETSTRATAAVQELNGAPFIWPPGLKRRAPPLA